jgi:hypothetical protein
MNVAIRLFATLVRNGLRIATRKAALQLQRLSMRKFVPSPWP